MWDPTPLNWSRLCGIDLAQTGVRYVGRNTVELVDPRFYHLDTCFCPLNDKLGMFFPGAFTKAGQKTLENAIELIEVPSNEALRFVCNAVVLGKNVVLPAGCTKTYDLLKTRGFTSYPVELSEFIKAGGAAKCLSLRLDQL